jgi:hypothetical protein
VVRGRNPECDLKDQLQRVAERPGRGCDHGRLAQRCGLSRRTESLSA